MQESIKRKLETASADHWKFITRNIDICMAQFPAEAGQDATSMQRQVTESYSNFHTYKEFHRDGHKYCEHREWEWIQGVEEEKNGVEGDETPWFPLEVKQPTITQPSLSSFSKQELKEWILPLQEVLSKTSDGEAFFLQSEFVRLEREERVYKDSFGRELVDLTWLATVDLLILPNDKPDAHPLGAEFRFSEFSPTDLQAAVRDRGRTAVRFAEAHPWTGGLPRAVYLRGHLVGEVMAMLVRRLTGLSLYTGLSQQKLGQPLFGKESEGDPITLQALSGLYNSPQTGFFDDQGIIFSRRILIEDGIIRSFLTSQETAHYLGLPLTGLNPNFSLAPGSLSRSEMTIEPALEILRWRTFDLDEATGRWSAVAEEALWYENRTQTPVFGVQLAGNLQDLLTRARFSQEIGTWENYEGPEFLQVPVDFLQGV